MILVPEGAGGPAGRPAARLIRYSRDAEIAAAEWLRFWGAVDARTHGPGADSGVDVESSKLVVQVKARVAPAGRPELQRLHGAAVGRGKQGAFFSLGGFTAQAVAWANQVDLALFEFDLQGEPRAVNEPAYRIARREPPVTDGEKGERALLAERLPLAVGQGLDDHARRNLLASIVDRMAQWRKKPTEKQLAFAQSLGIGVPEGWTANDVSRAIDARMAEIRLNKSRRAGPGG